MDITRHNQGVALAEFEHALSNCEFCAIDQEMTGVDVPGQSTLFGAPPAEVYRAKREATLAYNAFQFGIALFTRTGEESYDVRPYNFYLLNEQGDIRLSLSAISFLAENHMNFQKWLTSGMNYCTRDIEKERMETFRFDESTDDVFLSLKTQIELWYQGESTEELCVEVRCSARAARAIAVKLNTMDSFHVSTRYGGNPSHAENIVFSIRKLDAAAWSLERHRRVSVESEKQSVSLGFRKFWKLIVDSKKEIVGHNFAQDLMFMVNMHEEVLPASYEEFKLLVAKLFPRIYDTKTMARHVPGDNSFQNTHLGGLYTECRKRLESNPIQFSSLFRLPAGFYSYGDTSLEQCSKAHEAAYDAYMTGIVFSCLRNLLKQRTDTICNMISSFGSSYYVCINGSDVLVCRDTFLIDSRKECSVEDIKAIFYLMDDHQTNSPAAPKDFVPYQIMGCQRSSSQLFVSFSLVYPGSEVGVMCEKLSSLSESDFLQHNADFSIVGGLSISRLMDGFPS